MSKQWKPNKKTVELAPARPSRIRRDPVRGNHAETFARNAWWESREWEIRLGVIGIILFALAINAILFGVGQLSSH